MRAGGRVRAAIGMVLVVGVMVTGCAREPAPTGRELYEEAKGHYLAYREIAAGILTAVHDGDWFVGNYGALPDACDDRNGYEFYFSRYLGPGQPESRLERYQAGIAAITAAGLEVSAGSPDDPEAIWVVIARGHGIKRLVFDSSPKGGARLAITTDCHPGDSEALFGELFEEDDLVFDATPYFPKIERPDAEPLFDFPLDAPRYPDPDDTPTPTPTESPTG